MGQMMMVPAFSGEDEIEGDAYLGEDDDFEGEDDDGDDFEGDDDEALEIGRAVLAGELAVAGEIGANGRGFRRGGRRLRRCRQARHAMAQGQDEGGDELGYAPRTARRVARIDNRVERLQSRRARLAPPPVRRRKVYVTDDLLDLSLGGTGAKAGEVSVTHELQQNTYISNLTFDGSSAGARILQVTAGRTILWQNSSANGVPCSAFVNSGVSPFSLKGVKLLKGTNLVIRGKIAADDDQITALIYAKVETNPVGCAR
jgi:hypothetical protein